MNCDTDPLPFVFEYFSIVRAAVNKVTTAMMIVNIRNERVLKEERTISKESYNKYIQVSAAVTDDVLKRVSVLKRCDCIDKL